MRSRFVAILMLLLLVSCGDDRTIEQQIIATIELMEVAAENGEHFEFMGYVADSFKGQRGSMTRRDFHRFMIFQINQHRRLHAQLFPIRVQETFEGQASAQFNVLVTGGPGLLPDSGQLFEVKTHWILDGGDWLLSDADWVPLQLSDR